MVNYTQYIEDHYWSNVSSVQQQTKDQLRSIQILDATLEIPAALEQFKQDHTCSARRYLMLYFQRHATSVIDALDQFSYIHRDTVYLFHRVSNQQSQFLDPEERDAYIKLICEIAAENSGEEEAQWRPLIRKAMLWHKQPDLLTKEEAFRIGHGLRFTLEEMDAFLLRVLDNDGLSYTRSEDVIEAFCFLHQPANNCRIAQQLKKIYRKKTDSMQKQYSEPRPEGFTVSIEASLQSRIKQWETQENDVAAAFMQWLLSRAPYLDLPSRSAQRIYCRLAELAYQLTIDANRNTEESTFSQLLLTTCQQSGNPVIDENTAYRLSDKLLNTAALEFDNARKRQPNQVWRYLTVDPKGRATAVAAGARIPLLLTGTEAVTKADLLFMIWYIGDLCWIESNVTGQMIYDRTADFWSVSEHLLEQANLPGFYAPHMLERCFLKAICTPHNTEEYPFEVYEGMCEYVLPEKQERKRAKQGHRIAKTRAQLEREALTAYAEERLCFEGLAEPLFSHFKDHGIELGKYLFTEEGISYLPDPCVIIKFPEERTKERFRMDTDCYTWEDAAQERFHFVFGLSLFLQQRAEELGIRCRFRTNYQRKVSLTVLQWENL